MHNNLLNLPEWVVPDTNVLLNGTFVNGLARRALEALPGLNFKIVIPKSIDEEATGKLAKLANDLRLSFDPIRTFTEARARHVFASTPVPSVKHDRHVIAAAQACGAWVLTGDAPLVVRCGEAELESRLPWDVCFEASSKGSPENWWVCRWVGLTQREGSVFVRLLVKHLPSGGDLVIAEIENVGRLAYSPQNTQLSLTLEGGLVASVSWEIEPGQFFAVAGSYLLRGAAKGGHVRIFASKPEADPQVRTTPTLRRPLKYPPGRATLLQGLNDELEVSSTLRAVVAGPRTIGKKTWKALSSIPEGAPNPFDDDTLTAALLQIDRRQTSSGLLVFPTDTELYQYGLNGIANRPSDV